MPPSQVNTISPRDELTVRHERAILVSVSLPQRPWIGDDPLEELQGLAESAGAIVVGRLLQKRQRVEPATYIGQGKVLELAELCRSLNADVVIFDNDLTPAQTRNLEKTLQVKVLDRSELILDIFATRARTVEARLQVELAQLEYSLPRLKNLWKHLSRIRGGIGLRGPGETQLEEDRRLVAQRIRDLRRRLHEVEARKQRMVAARSREYTVSLVGYTNAGKSTLMNALTGAGVHVEDRLFSTLDTRTRQWWIPGLGRVLLSDTVGFIRDLPHHLVASFKATLEEARQAGLLLHVVDASNPLAAEHVLAVRKVLEELHCRQKPTILVLNKIDKLTDRAELEWLMRQHQPAVAVSAYSREGLDRLAEAVRAAFRQQHTEAEIDCDLTDGALLALVAAQGEILQQSFEDGRAHLRCRVPSELLPQLAQRGATVRRLDAGFQP
ncbi:MAG: GTPase HflX [Gemmatales bacterium]|nr:GTPase HflX [Gemmatales bacterium]MCS7161194.1 GTPase HflX [Gemmatales bacterium]MDW8176397.1 GTPase HflX [Gemmatales bacterium]